MVFYRLLLCYFKFFIFFIFAVSNVFASLDQRLCLLLDSIEFISDTKPLTHTDVALSKSQRLSVFLSGPSYIDQNTLNDFSRVMGVYPRTESGEKFFQDLYNSEIIARGDSYILGDLKLVDSDVLGEGFAAMVFNHPKDPSLVIKIPHSADDVAKLHLEKMVGDDLAQHMDEFHIRTLETNFLTSNKVALVKPKIDSRFLGSNIKNLSDIQKVKLELLWENASRYAQAKGIGLDLKADNLYWDSSLNDWVLIDTGPRFAYRPFGFTSDQKSFADYLKTWKELDPIVSGKPASLEDLRPKFTPDAKSQRDYQRFVDYLKRPSGDTESDAVAKRILDKLPGHHFQSAEERAQMYQKFTRCIETTDFEYDCYYQVMHDLFESDYGTRAKERVLDYTGSGFGDINDNLRADSAQPDISTITIQRIIQRERKTNPTRSLYRGTRISKSTLSRITQSVGQEAVIIDNAFMSSSDQVSIAVEFLELPNDEKIATMMMIKTKNYLDLRDVSEFTDESELLINSSSELFVKKVVKTSEYCKAIGKKMAIPMDAYLIFACEDKDCKTDPGEWQDLMKRVCG